MSDLVRVAVDAMGGDYAPVEPVKGAVEAVNADERVKVQLVGQVDVIEKELQKYTTKKLIVDIKEVKRPDKDAQLVAENIALQLENRISFRRARTEFYSEGTIPLQTLRADIDYGFAEADTTYGKVGVKAWVYNGEVLPTKGTKEGSDK